MKGNTPELCTGDRAHRQNGHISFSAYDNSCMRPEHDGSYSAFVTVESRMVRLPFSDRSEKTLFRAGGKGGTTDKTMAQSPQSETLTESMPRLEDDVLPLSDRQVGGEMG